MGEELALMEGLSLRAQDVLPLLNGEGGFLLLKGVHSFNEAIKGLHMALDEVYPSPFPFLKLVMRGEEVGIEVLRGRIRFASRHEVGPSYRLDDYLREAPSKMPSPSFDTLLALYQERGRRVHYEDLPNMIPLKNIKGEWNVLSSLVSDQSPLSFQIRDLRNSEPSVHECRGEGIFKALDKAKEYIHSLGYERVLGLNEALTNALVHNAYELGDPYVEIKDGGVSVVSHVYEAPLTSYSHPLNPSLFKAFKDLGLAPGAGLGESVLRNCKRETINGTYLVHLPNSNDGNKFNLVSGEINRERVGEIKSAPEIDPDAKAILDLIRLDPAIKRDELCARLKLSSRTLDRLIQRLKEDGKILGRTSNKNGKWVLPDLP